MKITLRSNAHGTGGCPLIEAEDGQDFLVQVDYDYPGVAETFGWSLREVQTDANRRARRECSHGSTDGTVDCSECGAKVGHFINAARDWIDNNDGAEVEDAGYFS